LASAPDLILVKDGLSRLAKRSALIPKTGFDTAIAAVKVSVVPSGYCSAEVSLTRDGPALRIDSGLLSALRLASLLVARHFDEGLFRVGAIDDETRASFARLFRAFLGQYYLLGNFRLEPPTPPDDSAGAVVRLITSEATAFVLGHELGHVVARHLGEAGATRWLDQALTTERTHSAAQEIEADALAVAIVLADLFGAKVPEGLADLRLLSIRLAYEVLSSVERCYLTPPSRSHLSAGDRWQGVLHFLHTRFPPSTIARVSNGWAPIADALRFPVTMDFEPSGIRIEDDLNAHGWPALSDAQDGAVDWDMAEETARQFWLRAAYQHALIGAGAMGIQDLSAIGNDELVAAGETVVEGLVKNLPRLLRGQSSAIRAMPGAGDLVRHLRRRDVWPEPFRSDSSLGLPIHLAAGAVARHLSNQSEVEDVG
jgi:hypothetical protein